MENILPIVIDDFTMQIQNVDQRLYIGTGFYVRTVDKLQVTNSSIVILH